MFLYLECSSLCSQRTFLSIKPGAPALDTTDKPDWPTFLIDISNIWPVFVLLVYCCSTNKYVNWFLFLKLFINIGGTTDEAGPLSQRVLDFFRCWIIFYVWLENIWYFISRGQVNICFLLSFWCVRRIVYDQSNKKKLSNTWNMPRHTYIICWSQCESALKH
jgi:hypothetical protein